MKKFATFAIMFAAVAVAGTALRRAASDETPAPSELTTGSAKPCCQAKACNATQNVADVAKPRCCEQECGSCAETPNESAASDSDAVAGVGTGKGLRHGQGMGPGMGKGMGRGMGMGRGHAGGSQHDKDHQDFFFLIQHRDSIRRTVKNLANGIESVTESDTPEVAEMIQVHVEAMYDRVEHGNPIRMRDPIFRAIFANADKIKMNVEHTELGVRVTETSDDPYVVKLIQEHARVVSLWIKNGYAELPKNHAAPKQ